MADTLIMLIYRIENPTDRRGPYFRAPGEPGWEVCGKISRLHADHPDPWDDGIKGYDVNLDWCGFTSMESLLDWFGSTLEHLEGIGYHLAAYEVEDHDVRSGNRQVVFTAHRAVQVDSRSIYDAVRFPYTMSCA